MSASPLLCAVGVSAVKQSTAKFQSTTTTTTTTLIVIRRKCLILFIPFEWDPYKIIQPAASILSLSLSLLNEINIYIDDHRHTRKPRIILISRCFLLDPIVCLTGCMLRTMSENYLSTTYCGQ